MSDDLISRQAAIDALDGIIVVGGRNTAVRMTRYIEAVRDRLKRLPSAQPESQWIPVTERFPELDQEVLVYAIGKDDGFIGDAVTTISERFIFRLFPSSDGVEEWRSPWQYFDSKYEITHWMPLPEPPKGE